MNDGHPASQLFTLRLWPESESDGGMRWRGKVTHVLSGETRYFREWPALLAFLEGTFVVADPEQSGWASAVEDQKIELD